MSGTVYIIYLTKISEMSLGINRPVQVAKSEVSQSNNNDQNDVDVTFRYRGCKKNVFAYC